MRVNLQAKKIILFSSVIAIVAEFFLIFIIYFNKQQISPLYDPNLQVWVNGLFNFLSAFSLLMAFLAVKNRRIHWHKTFIFIAFGFSACFLFNYIFYHMSVGHTKFINQTWRIPYLILLFSHLMTSVISLPFIFSTFSLGFFGKINDHKKMAKLTFFLWEFVSVTGVIIVLMLKFLN